MAHVSPPRLLLAPLRGVTSATFRGAYCLHFEGFDAAIAPFVSTIGGQTIRARHFRDLIPERNRSLPVIPQLLGNNAADFVRMADCLADLGYAEVNWNLGCPKGTVTRKKRGAGLLPFADAIAAFLDHAVTRVRVAISIKIRLGLDRADQILSIIPLLNDYPLASVVVHPRTATQQYSGAVDLEMFDEALRMSRAPIIYNGDITTLGTFSALAARFPGVDAWMIGRGAVTNPFLPSLIKGTVSKLPPDALERLRRFHDNLLEGYRCEMHGPGPLLGAMKELWAYLIDFFDGAEKQFKRIHKQRDVSGYCEAVEAFFAVAYPRAELWDRPN